MLFIRFSSSVLDFVLGAARISVSLDLVKDRDACPGEGTRLDFPLSSTVSVRLYLFIPPLMFYPRRHGALWTLDEIRMGPRSGNCLSQSRHCRCSSPLRSRKAARVAGSNRAPTLAIPAA